MGASFRRERFASILNAGSMLPSDVPELIANLLLSFELSEP